MEDKDIISKKEREETSTIPKQWIRLTRACNNRCVFCLDSEVQNGSCIPYKCIDKELRKGIRLDKKRAVFSGGEPTIHPHFFRIVSLAKKFGYEQIQVITNGRMFCYKGFLRKAQESGATEITFSFHGDTPELHDAQTRTKGSFRQSLQGLVNALEARNLVVDIDLVVNKMNVPYLSRILGFFSRMGIREFDLLQVIPFGSAWENRKKVFYRIEDNLNHLRKAFEFAASNNLIIWTNRFPAEYLQGYEYLIQHPHKLYDEINGRQELFKIFLRTGKALYCSGKRCAVCYLKSFCADLSIFKSKGMLAAKKTPLCLDIKGSHHKNVKSISLTGKIDLFKFLEFFLENRFFTKALTCLRCKYYKECDGISVYDAIAHGFGNLKPFK